MRAVAIRYLFLNHIDAWVVTLVVAAIALAVHDAFSLRTLYLALALAAGYWLAFALNDFYDAPYDALEPDKARRNFFVRAAWSARQMGLLVGGVGVLLLPAFAQFGWRGVGLAGLGLGVMWLYSAPPLRLKSRPGLDLLTHSLFVESFPYICCLILIEATWTRLDGIILGCTLLGSLSAQLEQQVRDYEVDRRTERNFTTRWGRNLSQWLVRCTTLLLIGWAGVWLSLGAIPRFLWLVGLIPLPALAHRLVRRPHVSRSQQLVYLSAAMGLLYAGALLVYAGWG